MTTRLLFVANYRLASACISLQWDHHLCDVDRTVVISPMPKQQLWQAFENHNINTSTFEYLPDQEFLPLYPQINNWLIPGDFRGRWLVQQAIKLSAVDYLDHDVMLIHDPDTFMVQNYHTVINGKLNLLAVENETHSRGYYEVLQNALGIDRQTTHCFVTELCAVSKEHFKKLKHRLETKNNCHWLDSIIPNVPMESTFRPEFPGEEVKWFSEYEMLGNWALYCDPDINIEMQDRFDYKHLEQLHVIPPWCTAICEAMPYEKSFSMDWDTLKVNDFDYWISVLKDNITCLTT